MKLYQPPPKKLLNLPVAKIRLDMGTQLRCGLNQATVEEYLESHDGGAVFPPVVVFHDLAELLYILAAGFHRMEMYRRAGVKSVLAEVYPGTVREAILFAAASNASHGLRQSPADKRRVVETLLSDDEWGKWSNREIAKHCGVSHFLVGRVRGEIEQEASGASGSEFQMRRYSRGGVQHKMDVTGLSKKKFADMTTSEQIAESSRAEAKPEPQGECPSCGHRTALCDFAI